MRNLSRRSVVLSSLGLLVGLLLALVPVLTVSANSPNAEPAKIRVEISDSGFNGQPDFGLEVEQGQVVELTFVFAQQGALSDEHIIVLKGYGLETPKLSFYNKEATLKFVADRPGTFEFACDFDCELHDKLKKGHLKVKGAAGSGSGVAAAALVATTLTAYPASWEVARGPVKLTASLKDKDGAPVAKAMVRFYVDGELAGTKGQMEVAAAKTDADGTAVVEYTPTSAGPQQIAVRFEGMGLYGESQQSFQLQVRSAQPAYSVAPRGLEPLTDRVPNGIVLLLGGIWSTFAFVLYQVVRIQGASRPTNERRRAETPSGSRAAVTTD